MVLKQGLLLAIGLLSHAMFNIVDLLLIAELDDPAALAGVHVATNINFLPMIIGNAISAATLSAMSRMIGRGEIDQARDLSSRSQILMLGSGVFLGLIGALFVSPSIDLQGVEGSGRDIGLHYLLVANLGTFTMFGLMQTTTTMRALGESLMPFVLLVGANVVNLLLDIVLLFGWEDMGIPAFGAPGAAYASVISRALAAGLGLAWLCRSGCGLRFSWVPLRGPLGQRRQVFAMATPQAAQMLVRGLVAIALTRLAQELGGQAALSALGVATRLETMVLFAAVGFASAGTAIAGRNVGAGNVARARRAGQLASLSALIFGACLVLVFSLAARPLMLLFLSEGDVGEVNAGIGYLQIAALGLPFSAFCIAATGAINGGGRFVPPMIIDAVGYLGFLLPCASLVVAVFAGATLLALWWIFVAVNACLACVYWFYLARANWADCSKT